MNFLRSNQINKVLAFVFTVLFNLIPTFYLRAAFFRILGYKIGKNVALHSWITFFDVRRNISIGSNVTINSNCYIDNRCAITIGNNVNISHSVRIYTLGHDIDDPYAKVVGQEVYIDHDVWIFPNVLIMPGVRIGRGAVVYPGSVVTKNVGNFEVVGGNPAKKIRVRNKDIRYTIDFRIWFAK